MTTRSAVRAAAGGLAIAVAAALLAAVPAAVPAAAATTPAATIESGGNPILADGSAYSADAAPLVVDDTLYVYAGHDEAGEQQASFVMSDYQVFATKDVESGVWDHYPENMVPADVFSWATGRSAFAGQVTTGADGKFYWYAPVEWENTSVPNRMAIGVAVSDSPTGPWTDAIGEPLLTWTDVFGSSTNGQEVIDPHVFTDTDGRVYLYWGSWSVARVVELDPSMTARKDGSTITTLSGLNGLFEAPWVFKRNGIYYMTYDWKQGGSACTPSNYQACVAYATATSPLGPWTYQGIILGGTSATTVHPSIIEFKGKWYLTYHTKDAKMGGHFRRSVAIDELTWDGDRILPVTQTWADDPKYKLSDNLATGAQVSASFTEQPPMRLGALNDGRQLTALLPPDQWGNYRGTTSSNPSDWVQYQWDAPGAHGQRGHPVPPRRQLDPLAGVLGRRVPRRQRRLAAGRRCDLPDGHRAVAHGHLRPGDDDSTARHLPGPARGSVRALGLGVRVGGLRGPGRLPPGHRAGPPLSARPPTCRSLSACPSGLPARSGRPSTGSRSTRRTTPKPGRSPSRAGCSARRPATSPRPWRSAAPLNLARTTPRPLP